MSGKRDEANLFGVTPKKKRASAPPLPNGVVQRLLGIWVGLFETKFHEKPVILPRDGAALKRLISHAGAEAVERRLPRYLALEDAYVIAEGYPLVLLQSSWNKLIVAEKATASRLPDADETDKYLRDLRGGRA